MQKVLFLKEYKKVVESAYVGTHPRARTHTSSLRGWARLSVKAESETNRPPSPEPLAVHS